MFTAVLKLCAVLVVALVGSVSASTGLVIKSRNTSALVIQSSAVGAGSISVTTHWYAASNGRKAPVQARPEGEYKPSLVNGDQWRQELNSTLVRLHHSRRKFKTNPRDQRRAELLRRRLRRQQRLVFERMLNMYDSKLKHLKSRHKELCELVYGKDAAIRSRNQCMTGSKAGNRKVKSPEAHVNSGSMTAGHRDGRSLSDSTLLLAAGGGLSTCALVACMVPGRSNHPRLPPRMEPRNGASV